MKCYICDNLLKEQEINWNSDHDDWEPCVKCLREIDDIFHDHPEENELREIIEKEVAMMFYEQDTSDIRDCEAEDEET